MTIEDSSSNLQIIFDVFMFLGFYKIQGKTWIPDETFHKYHSEVTTSGNDESVALLSTNIFFNKIIRPLSQVMASFLNGTILKYLMIENIKNCVSIA